MVDLDRIDVEQIIPEVTLGFPVDHKNGVTCKVDITEQIFTFTSIMT